MTAVGFQNGLTVAEIFSDRPVDPGRNAAARAALDVKASAIQPPKLLDLERHPDPREDPAFEPTPAGWRPLGDIALGEYLGTVETYLRKYVSFPSHHEAVAVALWIAHAYVVERFETSPILAVTSAEMRSGKTRVLDCLELLVPQPVRMVMPSEAVFYSVLAKRPRPTVLLDEVDALFGPRPSERTEGLRAVLNSGNRAGTPVLRVRMDGRSREVEEFDVFGPKAVAGIGELPSTVADRSIVIRMRRRAPDEIVARFRRRHAGPEAKAIKVPDWSSVPLVPDVPDVPEGLSDRAADGWEPMLSVADAAGGLWPARARAAAIALSDEEDGPASSGVRLLADIKDVFADTPYMQTPLLLEGLCELDGSPWGEWYGAPLTARALAKLLAPYRVGPAQKRVKGEKSRGYFATDFADAWRRYVPAGTRGTSGTSGTDWDPESATDDDGEVAA